MQEIFDSHAHAFPDAIAEGAVQTLIGHARMMPVQAYHDGTVSGLLKSMDGAGIGRSVLCSVATRPTQVRKITDWSVSIASQRIIPFASIHPDFPEPEAEVRRIADAGLRGIKLHPQYMNCAIDDERMVRIVRAAADAGLAITFHSGWDLGFTEDELAAPRRIRSLKAAVPKARMLACHLGGWRRWEEALQYVAGQEIYMETSYVLGQCPADLLERILRKHPPEFLLFGTDCPWADQADEVAKFRALPLDQKLIDDAMCENVERFAGLTS